jgi:hypothetical protein
MYLDQRSTVLAVDNLNGAKVGGRTLRVRPLPCLPFPRLFLRSASQLTATEMIVVASGRSHEKLRAAQDKGRRWGDHRA